MRRHHTLLILFTLLLTLPFACGQGKDDKLLEQFRQLRAAGDTLPEEALARLDSLKGQMTGKSTYMQMRYNLLRTRLQDKAYIVPTSDSLMKEVHAYFEKYGTDAEKMEARYYLARVYRELNDIPRSLTYFLEAYELGEEGEGIDTMLWITTCSQLIGIYTYQKMHKASIPVAKKELELSMATNTVDPVTYMDLSTPYDCLGDSVEALRYNDFGLNEVMLTHTEEKYPDILAESILTYTAYGQREKAKRCYEALRRIPPEKKAHNQDIACAEYALHFLPPDSAIHHALQAWQHSKIWGIKHTASVQLLKAYHKKGMYKEASHWGIMVDISDDSLRVDRQKEETRKAYQDYHYYRNMGAEQRAYRKAQLSQMKMYAGIGISALVLMAMATLFFYYKKRMAEELLRKEREIKAARSNVKAKEEELHECQRIIRQKEEKLEDMCKQIACLDTQLQEAETELNSKKEQNELLMKLRLQATVSEDAPEIMEKIMRAADRKCTLTEKEWSRLMCVIDMRHPDLLEKLTRIFPNQEQTYMRTAYLVAAGMTNAQIAKLTHKSASTVWRTAKKVRNLLGMQDKSDAPMPEE